MLNTAKQLHREIIPRMCFLFFERKRKRRRKRERERKRGAAPKTKVNIKKTQTLAPSFPLPLVPTNFKQEKKQTITTSLSLNQAPLQANAQGPHWPVEGYLTTPNCPVPA